MNSKEFELFLLHADASFLLGFIIVLPAISVVATLSPWGPFPYRDAVFVAVLVCSLCTFIMLGKYQATLTRRYQLEQLEKAVEIDLEKTTSLEASFARSPRKIFFNRSAGGNPPSVYQRWMLFNPLVWLMFYYLFVACTTDDALRKNSEKFSATLIRNDVSSNSWQAKATVTLINYRSDQTFAYTVNNKQYFAHNHDAQDTEKVEGTAYPIWALPSDPAVHEPIGEPPGTKQRTDLLLALLCFLCNACCEIAIWFHPLRHRRLASIGEPQLVTIKSKTLRLTQNAGPRAKSPPISSTNLMAIIELNDDGGHVLREMKLRPGEYARIQEGVQELALRDPLFKENFILYRFCKYHVGD